MQIIIKHPRQINAERADRLSRYLDAALKDAGILPDASPGVGAGERRQQVF